MPLHDKYVANLEEAKEFELFASDAMSHGLYILPVVYRSRHFQTTYGETLTGIEFKHDKRFRETGNLFVETAESWHQDVLKKPAGIYHESSPWLFVIGDYSTFWVFATRCLQRQHELGSYPPKTTPTSDGFLLPVRVADEIAARKWEC